MSEYIKREAALMAVMRAGCLANTVQILKDIPAADVVEVVRCKNCNYRDTGDCAFDCYNFEATDDAFCCYGVRGDNDAKTD